MKRTAITNVGLGLFFLLLLLASPTNAAQISLADYALLKPGSWSRFTYLAPVFPDFTIQAVTLTSGPFAGKYRVGDYRFPGSDRMAWRIMDWDNTTAFIYATDEGVFDPPIPMPLNYQTDTLIPHPFESGIYWYFQLIPSLTVTAGTFNDVLQWFVLDSQYPPNTINTQFGLSVPYAVTVVDWYGRDVADLRDLDVDAASGNINYTYDLLRTGRISANAASLPLLLLLD